MIRVGCELVASVESAHDKVVGAGRGDADGGASGGGDKADVGKGRVGAAGGAPRDAIAGEVSFGARGPSDGTVLNSGLGK